VQYVVTGKQKTLENTIKQLC